MTGSALLPQPHSASAKAHLPEIRVVVLGDSLVGKTSILRQYLDHEGLSTSVGHEPTLLDSYAHIEFCGSQPYWVHLTDCSSAPEFREHRAAYLAKCDVVILVFSALQHKTLSNLRNWMKEVVEARTSTGPARFASTRGNFSEVPIFVVGTHYSEAHTSSAQKSVSLSEAESVTMDCLHSAGYFLNEEDADMEEELRLQRATSKKGRALSSKKRSPNAFRSFFANLFKGGAADDDDDDRQGKASRSNPGDKATKRSKMDDGVKSHQHCSLHSRSASQPHTPYGPATERPHGLAESIAEGALPSDDSQLAALPPGASPRLPLYLLSNKDGEAVNTAVRVSLALHLWCKQFDYSGEISPGVTPLTSPRQQGTVLLVPDKLTGTGGARRTESTPLTEITGLTLQHGRSISVVSNNSHTSERSATSYIPSMHALYDSVASLSAFDVSFHHSCATSWGPLVGSSSPPASGQPSQMLVAVGGATPPDAGYPLFDGGENTEPLSCSSTYLPRHKGPQAESHWCSPTVSSPGRVEKQDAGAAPNVKKVPSGVSPAEPEGTQCDVKPVPSEQLVQANSTLLTTSPPNPQQDTAPNTATRGEITVCPRDLPVSIQQGEYSLHSCAAESGGSHMSPTWATGDTPAPRGSGDCANIPVDFPGRVWKDVDAEDHLNNTANIHGQASATDSVVKKLALEIEGPGTAVSATTSPRKSPMKSTGASPSHKLPELAVVDAAANAVPHAGGASAESTVTTPCSPGAASPAPIPPLRGASRSQTRPPPREDDALTRGSSFSASNSQSRTLAKNSAWQKQKTRQCSSDGCTVM